MIKGWLESNRAQVNSERDTGTAEGEAGTQGITECEAGGYQKHTLVQHSPKSMTVHFCYIQ